MMAIQKVFAFGLYNLIFYLIYDIIIIENEGEFRKSTQFYGVAQENFYLIIERVKEELE